MSKQTRCAWAGVDQIYIDYHDYEWGRPEYNSRKLFENLALEGFQAGLSWITILKRRDNFRKAFAGFDPYVLADWSEAHIDELMNDRGIIRHRKKITAQITNAKAWIAIEENIGFSQFIWSYVDGVPLINNPKIHADVPAQTPLSMTLSKDLKKAGFKFCGPKITYAFLQASGIVNDHIEFCEFKVA